MLKLSNISVWMFCASYGLIGVTGILRPIYILPLSIVFLLLGFFFALPSFRRGYFSKKTWLPNLTIFCLILQSLLVCLFYWSNVLIAHLFATIFVFVVWVQGSEIIMGVLNAVPRILITNVVAIYLSCVFALVGYCINLFLGYDPFELFGRLKPTTAIIASGVPRLYGLSSQPSNFAYYIAAFAPLAFATHRSFINNQKWNRYTIAVPTLLVALCFLLTFSVGAFLAVLISTLLILGFHRKIAVICLAVICCLTFFSALSLISPEIIENMYGKLSLNTDFKSADQRLDAAINAFSVIKENPLGSGLGYLTKSSNSTAINWYLTFWAEAGTIGIFLFSLFSVSMLFIINRTPKEFHGALRFGFLCMLISLNFHSTIGTSPIWPLSALILAMARLQPYKPERP